MTSFTGVCVCVCVFMFVFQAVLHCCTTHSDNEEALIVLAKYASDSLDSVRLELMLV